MASRSKISLKHDYDVIKKMPYTEQPFWVTLTSFPIIRQKNNLMFPSTKLKPRVWGLSSIYLDGNPCRKVSLLLTEAILLYR